MGWQHRAVGLMPIAVRLDAQGGPKEREHLQLAAELDAELRQAVAEVLRKPKYQDIQLFDIEYYLEDR